MSNTEAKNVLFCDTDATTYARNLNICGIKYIGNTSGTITIKDETSGGALLWQESGASNVWNPECEIKASKGIYITITNGAKVYLYLE